MRTIEQPMPTRAGLLSGGPVVLAVLVAVVALRLAPVIRLDASAGLAWSAPIAASLVALAAAAAVLLALARALNSGGLTGYLNAAGTGVLAGTYLIEAIAGPGSAGHVPTAASAVGGVVAALLLLGGAALGLRPARVRGSMHAVSVVVLFVITELGLALVALAMADGFRRPDELILRLAGAGLLALTAVLVSLHARHAVSPALLALGTLLLAVARVGTADVLVALTVLAGGMVVFVVHHLDLRGAVAAAPSAGLLTTSTEPPDEHAVLPRLMRELHGTIEELIQARRTIDLQRSEIQRGATVDELTGVSSRRAILARLRAETAEARRYDHPLAVLVMDIDGLAEINRDHGLAVGDAVLREIALRLRLRVREADAIGRVGADGFLAILPHTDERGAAVFADTLRRRIGQREVVTSAGALITTLSIGVAIVRPGTGLTDEDVLAEAGMALASAKASGGNRIAFDRAHGLARLEERRAEERRAEERHPAERHPDRDVSSGA